MWEIKATLLKIMYWIRQSWDQRLKNDLQTKIKRLVSQFEIKTGTFTKLKIKISKEFTNSNENKNFPIINACVCCIYVYKQKYLLYKNVYVYSI